MIQRVTKRDRGWAMWPWYFIPSWVVGTIREAAYVEHEKTHCRRQKWVTPIWWIRWRLSRKFRWEEESLAYRNEIDVLLRSGHDIDLLYYSKQLSEGYYKMVTFHAAYAWLKRILNE
jgi:hypothetical protein